MRSEPKVLKIRTRGSPIRIEVADQSLGWVRVEVLVPGLPRNLGITVNRDPSSSSKLIPEKKMFTVNCINNEVMAENRMRAQNFSTVRFELTLRTRAFGSHEDAATSSSIALVLKPTTALGSNRCR